MHFGPRPAYNGAGEQIQDVLVVNTLGGIAPHLSWASSTSTKTFCGLAPDRVSRTWFELAGCAKCQAAAKRKGVARVTDVDGHLIDL
ncbi:hypothetical protein AB6N24_17895 [Cellulomonas sp. 179-A 4D5 NHS]|uniref:hypothetical protein n=1 Tax=Cellulomonas sp. 179-A 4D5 NHS TaxID=3142378 RepID=UPI00399FDF74